MANVHDFMVLPSLPDSLKQLELIAGNMFWSWNPDLSGLFKRIDSKLWKACGHNPVKLLGRVSQTRLEGLAENHGFLCELQRAAEKLQSYLDGQTWFEKACSEDSTPTIAYFSAEFGVHELEKRLRRVGRGKYGAGQHADARIINGGHHYLGVS